MTSRRIVSLIGSIVLSIIFIMIFPYLVGYRWSRFDASINSWELTSQFISIISAGLSLITLFGIIITLRINRETLDLMKAERDERLKAHILVQVSRFNLVSNKNTLHLSLSQGDAKSTKPECIIINIGQNHALDIKVFWYFRNQKRVFEDAKKIEKLILQEIAIDPSININNKFIDYLNGSFFFKKTSFMNNFHNFIANKIDYIKNDQELKITVPDHISKVILLYKLYDIIIGEKAINLGNAIHSPNIHFHIEYTDLCNVKHDLFYELGLPCRSNLSIYKNYILRSDNFLSPSVLQHYQEMNPDPQNISIASYDVRLTRVTEEQARPIKT